MSRTLMLPALEQVLTIDVLLLLSLLLTIARFQQLTWYQWYMIIVMATITHNVTHKQNL